MSKRDSSELFSGGALPGKKVKTEDARKAIVLTSPGCRTTDTRIVVFNQEFHVSSDSLKVLSVYFKRFLDPINQPNRKPASEGFKYEWFSKIDGDDGCWGLTDDPKARDSDLSMFAGDISLMETCFHKLLAALFSQQTLVTNIDELNCLTDLASYFLCLPAVSNSLHQAMMGNEALSRSIAAKPSVALDCAYRLRHKVLFQEAMIYLMGPWSKPRFRALESEKLKVLALYIHARMQRELEGINHQLRLIQANKETYGDHGAKHLQAALCTCFQSDGDQGTIIYPQYYRKLTVNKNLNNRDKIPENLGATLQRILEPINKSCLKIDTMGARSGIGSFKDCFLCFEVSDRELPWDPEQLDWDA